MQLAERLVVVFRRRIRRGGMLLVAEPERFPETPRGHLPHQAGLRGELVVEAYAAQFLAVRALEIDVELRVRRVPDAGPRLALVLVVHEVVQLVSDERTTERRAELLIVDGLDSIQHRVVGVEFAVAEVTAEGTREAIATRLRDGVDLHAGRPALGCVEPVRDELKLRDRILAVPRLTAGPDVG